MTSPPAAAPSSSSATHAAEPPQGSSSRHRSGPHAHVASQTHGRLRVRVKNARAHPQLMSRLQEHLEAQPGTHQVQVNHHTGSVLVNYDPRTQSHASILQLFRDLGVAIGDVARGLDLDAPELSGHSEASETIVDSFSDLDRQIALLTGHKVDLKLLFPLALGGVGVWQLATRGLGMTEVPAYVLLWYAFDSFWKFHRQPSSTQNGAE